jgi:phage shock protein E
MMNEPRFFMITGVISTVYAIYAGLKYYALSGIGLLTSREARQKIISGEITTVIDVRTKMEYNLGHFQGAVHIPVGDFSKRKFVGMKRDDGVLVYCNTGQRARRAAEKLREDYGFIDVYYIEGSYRSLRS